MKLLIATLIAGGLLAGCQSQSTGSGGIPGPSSTGTSLGRNQATAVPIRTRSEIDGSKMIQQWIRANYPGYAIQDQEVFEDHGRSFSMVTIFSPGKAVERVWFDISMIRRSDDNMPPVT